MGDFDAQKTALAQRQAVAQIQSHLPTNQTGPARDDDRRIIIGIIHMLQCGARWRDCPPDYGPYTTIYNRFNRWVESRCGAVAVG